MQLTLHTAMRTQTNSRQLAAYSKCWNAGDTLRVYYPIVWDEKEGMYSFAIGSVWGHNINDAKALGLGAIFIPSTCQFDDYGTLTTPPDIAYSFSRIAPLFIKGQHDFEIRDIESRKWPSESAKREAVAECEIKYSKDNKNPVKPIIGKCGYNIYIEVLSVKMVNDVPDLNTIQVSIQKVSNQLATDLCMILSDKKFAPKDDEGHTASFLEVEWKYPTDTNKAESGRKAKPNGVSAEYRLESTHPDIYEKIKGHFSRVAHDAEAIQHHAVKSVDQKQVKGALSRYAFYNSQYLDALENKDDQDQLVNAAPIIAEVDFAWAIKNEDLAQRINKALQETGKNENEEFEKAKAEAMAKADEPETAPTFGDVMSGIGEEEADMIPEGMRDLMANPNNLGANDADAAMDAGFPDMP